MVFAAASQPLPPHAPASFPPMPTPTAATVTVAQPGRSSMLSPCAPAQPSRQPLAPFSPHESACSHPSKLAKTTAAAAAPALLLPPLLLPPPSVPGSPVKRLGSGNRGYLNGRQRSCLGLRNASARHTATPKHVPRYDLVASWAWCACCFPRTSFRFTACLRYTTGTVASHSVRCPKSSKATGLPRRSTS